MRFVKKALLVLAVAGVLAAGFTACQKQEDVAKGEKSKAYSTRAAMLGGPNVEYANPAQYKCPVTGEKLSSQYYVDTDEGRVYFHSQEAKNKFQNNPDQYLSDVKQQK